MNCRDIINFWFEDLASADWWEKSQDLDALIRDRFMILHTQAAAGELFGWRTSPEGALAEIIILDQFSRNMYRDSPESFAYDGMALILAQRAIEQGLDQKLEPMKRAFFYMPFMHSESLAIHELAEQLFSQPGMAANYDFELQHAAIIKKFGRYPHRNAILGRTSTPDEISFLNEPGSSF